MPHVAHRRCYDHGELSAALVVSYVSALLLLNLSRFVRDLVYSLMMDDTELHNLVYSDMPE